MQGPEEAPHPLSPSPHPTPVLQQALLKCKCQALPSPSSFSYKCFKSQKRVENEVFQTAASHPPPSLIRDCSFLIRQFHSLRCQPFRGGSAAGPSQSSYPATGAWSPTSRPWAPGLCWQMASDPEGKWVSPLSSQTVLLQGLGLPCWMGPAALPHWAGDRDRARWQPPGVS